MKLRLLAEEELARTMHQFPPHAAVGVTVFRSQGHPLTIAMLQAYWKRRPFGKQERIDHYQADRHINRMAYLLRKAATWLEGFAEQQLDGSFKMELNADETLLIEPRWANYVYFDVTIVGEPKVLDVEELPLADKFGGQEGSLELLSPDNLRWQLGVRDYRVPEAMKKQTYNIP